MKTLALDSNNNLVLSGGNLVFSTEGAKVVQTVKNRLLTYRGEWFLDEDYGTPWFQTIFVTPVNLSRVESVIKDIIETTDGVDKVISLSVIDFNTNNRKLSISFEAETIYGIINSNNLYINI